MESSAGAERMGHVRAAIWELFKQVSVFSCLRVSQGIKEIAEAH